MAAMDSGHRLIVSEMAVLQLATLPVLPMAAMDSGHRLIHWPIKGLCSAHLIAGLSSALPVSCALLLPGFQFDPACF